MDTTSAPPPWKEPHTPISEAEMTHPEHDNRGRNTLLTLASLLVLAGIVGITLWLYIQNKTNSSKATNTDEPENNQEDEATNLSDVQIIPVVSMAPEATLQRYGVVCRNYNSIEDALKEAQVACGLDLSGKELTTVPNEVNLLKNLTQINLSTNNLTDFPRELYGLPNVYKIDLSNNNLNSIPEDVLKNMPRLQEVILDGNDLSQDIVVKYRNLGTRLPAVE